MKELEGLAISKIDGRIFTMKRDTYEAYPTQMERWRD